MLRLSVLMLILFGTGLSAWAQQPFFTDDADVTSKGRFHFELSNQFSFLQDTAFPNRRQNALVYQLNYGLRDEVEISIDSPYLVIINAPQTISPRIAAGVGDTNVAIKWNFRRERDRSRWPALTIAYAVEVPTGEISTQLGSGVFDYRLIAIAQKTLSRGVKLRINQGVLFSGNTLTGVVGLRAQGFVYLAGVSLVRQFTPSLLAGCRVNYCARSKRRGGKQGSAAAAGGGKIRNTRESDHRLWHCVRPTRRESPRGIAGRTVDRFLVALHGGINRHLPAKSDYANIQIHRDLITSSLLVLSAPVLHSIRYGQAANHN